MNRMILPALALVLIAFSGGVAVAADLFPRTLFSGFSLSINGKDEGSRLQVVDLIKDGVSDRLVRFDAIHPLYSLEFNITANHFNESVVAQWSFNGQPIVKARFPGVRSATERVPLSILGR